MKRVAKFRGLGCFFPMHQKKKLQWNNELDEKLRALYLATSETERVVGWYSTLPVPVEGADEESIWSMSTFEIHQAYEEKTAESSGLADPVLLTIDTSLKKPQLSISAYTGTLIGLKDDPLIGSFSPMPFAVTADDAERIGVDTLIKGKPGAFFSD
jgi:hypothetical protein